MKDSDMVRVAFLVSGFKLVKEQGEGVARYAQGLWSYFSTVPASSGITIDKVELGSRVPGAQSVLQGMFQLATTDFSKYDIIHTVEPIEFLPIRRGAAKVVTTVHDIPQAPSNLSMLYVMRKLRRYQMFSSDYLLPSSESRKRELIELGMDADKVIVVNHGIENKFSSKVPRRVKNKQFVVGTLGALNEVSCVDRFIRAAKLVKQKSVSFQICGRPGVEADSMKRLAEGDSRITFKGYIPDAKLVETFDGFDIYVSPRPDEGFGLSVLEAQTRGVPVIIFSNTKMPYETRKYCIEVKDEREMACVIESLAKKGFNEKRRANMSSYARQFTLDNTAKKCIEIYKQIAQA